MADLYVVNQFSGAQYGTKDNPMVARSAQDFDALMKAVEHRDDIEVHLTGEFKTRGAYEWGPFADLGWRAGKHWTFDGDGELAIDPSAIDDLEIDDAPLHVICTSEQLVFPETSDVTPEEVWDDLPRGQAVRGLTLRGNHSALADRWKARGKMLRTSGVILQGNEAAIENVRLLNFGALKGEGRALSAESFPAIIVGAMGAPDRDKIAQLDPATHRFDDGVAVPSHITGCTFDEFDSSCSDDQVTVFMVMGSIGEPRGWNTGGWLQTMRADCFEENNTVIASGVNLVQGFTIYQSLKGRVRVNKTRGVNVSVYGDFYSNKGVQILENDFEARSHGVQLLLSPSGPCPEQFSHEDYVIGPQRMVTGGANVSIDTLGPTTAKRFIRNITVDESLSLENKGGGVIRSGTGTVRKGCNPFAFLRR